MKNTFEAMMFAREAHKGQVRKYTNNPYTDHLAEVAGVVATLSLTQDLHYKAVSVAWLHDTLEDTATELFSIHERFGSDAAYGVQCLTDCEIGNRKERKAAACLRLAGAPGWVQSVKCSDLLSHTSSIVQHDPNFARTYLYEKEAALEAMTQADPGLRELTISQLLQGFKTLNLTPKVF